MDINIRDMLTLNDGKKYIVTGKAQYENKEYLCLVDINDDKNIKFCYLNNDKIVVNDDKNINSNLIPLFLESAKHVLND